MFTYASRNMTGLAGTGTWFVPRTHFSLALIIVSHLFFYLTSRLTLDLDFISNTLVLQHFLYC